MQELKSYFVLPMKPFLEDQIKTIPSLKQVSKLVKDSTVEQKVHGFVAETKLKPSPWSAVNWIPVHAENAVEASYLAAFHYIFKTIKRISHLLLGIDVMPTFKKYRVDLMNQFPELPKPIQVGEYFAIEAVRILTP